MSLSDTDVADLVSFLESLTSDTRPGLAPASPLRAASATVRVEDLDGAPVCGLEITVRPAGDRLAGTDALPEAFTVKTSARGEATFEMPASTQFALASRLAPGESSLYPDWTSSVRVISVEPQTVAVSMRFAADVAPPESFDAVADSLFSSRAPIRFKKVRWIGDGEALYAATPVQGLDGDHACILRGVTPAGGACCLVALDLSGGAMNRVDVSSAPPGEVLDDRAVRDEAQRKAQAAIRLLAAASRK